MSSPPEQTTLTPSLHSPSHIQLLSLSDASIDTGHHQPIPPQPAPSPIPRLTITRGSPPPYEAPPAYQTSWRGKAFVGKVWKGVRERWWGWRGAAVLVGTWDLITNLLLFFLIASHIATSKISMFAIILPVILIVISAIGRMAIIRSHTPTLLIYTFIYFLRWSSDLITVTIHALTDTLDLLYLKTNEAILMGGVVGVRALYRVLVPCVVGGDGECRSVEKEESVEGLGGVVVLVCVMITLHLLFLVILTTYTIKSRTLNKPFFHSSPSSSISSTFSTYDEESDPTGQCPQANYQPSATQMTLLSVPPLPPAPALRSSRSPGARRSGTRRVVFAEGV
ncbi:hypothetical protein HK097_002001 [Rhizophlyctis rosea]|uniref:Transmembrane protein n=1 Tax=Rhizophlyctis rosea TaxID=64517 RepID=A0AAD5X0Y7_9FUNG|nr:hypothetical protein HK097_002001 [Rhizophlyctis rosea]